MNRVLQPDPRERFKGLRYKTYPFVATGTTQTISRIDGDFFKYDITAMKSETDSFPITNLKTPDIRMSIVTHWALDWAHEQYVLIRGELWMIEKVYSEPDTSAYNPTASVKYILDLLKAANPAGLKL